MLLKTAVRNILRNKIRSTITVAAIAAGLMVIHFVLGLTTGQYYDMIKVGVSQLAGHVVVQAPGYQEKLDGDIVVTEASAVTEALRAEFPQAKVAARMSLGGLLVSPTSSVGAGLMGLEAQIERDIQEVDDKVIEGTWLDGDNRGIVIGYKLAETLGVGVGDKVVYMGQHGGASEMASRLFRVKGIFRTGGPEQDSFVAYADLTAAQEAFGKPDVANRVTVHFDEPTVDAVLAAEAAAAARLKGRSGVEVVTWQEALPEMSGFIQLDKNSNDVLLTILGIIVAMGVLNTMLMSAMERTREFGVLLAIGTSPWRLVRLILLEGALIGVIGSLIGFGLGSALVSYFGEHGIDYSGMLGSETIESVGVAISAVMHPRFNWLRMTNFTVGAVVFTTLAAAYPALYVARLRPVEAMRHV